MLTKLYIDALLVDEYLADQVWELWDVGVIPDTLATRAWFMIVQQKSDQAIADDYREVKWSPCAVLDAGKTETIIRGGMATSLDNDGDTIELIDPSGTVIGQVTYAAVSTGQVIRP